MRGENKELNELLIDQLPTGYINNETSSDLKWSPTTRALWLWVFTRTNAGSKAARVI